MRNAERVAGISQIFANGEVRSVQNLNLFPCPDTVTINDKGVTAREQSNFLSIPAHFSGPLPRPSALSHMLIASSFPYFLYHYSSLLYYVRHVTTPYKENIRKARLSLLEKRAAHAGKRVGLSVGKRARVPRGYVQVLMMSK